MWRQTANNKINEKVEYITWNNPNKLVSRLRIFLASQTVGHHGHDNRV